RVDGAHRPGWTRAVGHDERVGAARGRRRAELAVEDDDLHPLARARAAPVNHEAHRTTARDLEDEGRTLRARLGDAVRARVDDDGIRRRARAADPDALDVVARGDVVRRRLRDAVRPAADHRAVRRAAAAEEDAMIVAADRVRRIGDAVRAGDD